MWQGLVEDPFELGWGKVGIRLEITNLAQGVDARVGPARHEELHGMAADFGQPPFERPLHGFVSRLPLPTPVRGSVVFDGQPNVSAQRSVPG